MVCSESSVTVESPSIKALEKAGYFSMGEHTYQLSLLVRMTPWFHWCVSPSGRPSESDNRPGISDEKKEILFDPERRFGGVGIHQALRIAQKYDGHISIDDRVANDSSQGAKFRLWLPRSDTST